MNSYSLLLVLFISYYKASSAESNCYKELGCFPNKYPWFSLLRPIMPAVTPEEVNTTFYIINRKNGPMIPIPAWPQIDLKGNFNPKKSTFVITHGYKSNIRIKWSSNLTNAILSKVEGNIILVDWQNGSSYNYLRCLSNIRIVAAEITRLIKYLINHQSANASAFHLLGHSLGAHIMSYVGKNIPGIARITALDPARPGFQGKHPAVRLHSGDAKFIDVLHTDGRPLLGLGMSDSVGHVDFYFNGGRTQPRCATFKFSNNLKSLLNIPKMTINLLYDLAICSHVRAPVYMAAAIEKCRMWGHPYKGSAKLIKKFASVNKQPCTNETCTVVGLDTPKYVKQGNFVVYTTGIYPYCTS